MRTAINTRLVFEIPAKRRPGKQERRGVWLASRVVAALCPCAAVGSQLTTVSGLPTIVLSAPPLRQLGDVGGDAPGPPPCTTGKERLISRWEHEHVLEAVQKRLDRNPQAMRQRRETAEHPFATLKMRMGATHFLMKRLPRVATEMALHVWLTISPA